jgi:4-amino-4-deoxy-L-arabinose transferase-like glycosyltransferase
VTEATTPVSDKAPARRTSQIGWGLLICATLYVCYFSHLGAIGFVGPDEPRYAWIARDMMETGDWVTPRLYGKPWFEKPPLLYWGAGLCFKWFGVSEAAARLPSVVSALLATLALAWLARRLYGVETARWLLLLLPTTVGMIGFSHAAATDMPFSAMLTIAMVCAAVVLGLTRDSHMPILPRTPWLALVSFGLALGLAVLAKGPAAIILSGGAVFFWALFTKRWRDAFRLLHPIAIALFCVTALPWYTLCARRNSDFLRVFLIEHNFKRYLTPEFQHVQPFWFYAPVLLVAFLPWTALFLWSSAQGAMHLWRRRLTQDSTWLFICWVVVCLIFFSISQSKLPGYILPAIPAATLLVSHLIESSPASTRRSLVPVLLVTAVSLAISGVLFSHSVVHLTHLGFVLHALGLSIFLLGISFLSGLSNRARALLIASGISMVLVLVGSANILMKRANLISLSADWLANVLYHDSVPADRLRVFRISRSLHYGLNFYLHREVPEWETDQVQDGYVLSDGNYCDRLKTQQKCVDLWGTRNFSSGSWALLRVTSDSSAHNNPGSGEAQQEK